MVGRTRGLTGGSASPLVVYGDTSQDGLWYSGRPAVTSRSDNLVLGEKLFDQVATADDYFRFPRANPFDFAGHDIIDASAMFGGVADAALPSVGITVRITHSRRTSAWPAERGPAKGESSSMRFEPPGSIAMTTGARRERVAMRAAVG